ncbi:uncharacterized protein AKAME5_000537900 [Lates japonicus]|uniref:Uncharacterized protein n=1 Tax=Lates japonicus TaxID=270547 RepID=A0AAD3MF99_LATJO|nr:uncharacterized protein AKAME5_000537900 [Lates japonicus]
MPYFQPQSKSKVQAVRVARTVARQEYVVRGSTHVREPLRGEVMLTPTKGFVEKHKVLVACVLAEAQPTKVVPLRILNPGNTTVTIKEGAIAGFLQSVKVLQPTETTAQPGQTPSSRLTVP